MKHRCARPFLMIGTFLSCVPLNQAMRQYPKMFLVCGPKPGCLLRSGTNSRGLFSRQPVSSLPLDSQM
ncbi:hypothetical protein DPMN_169955 [Dreissena polymorpha]|uniref:Secreted protein n=1 Tax=Dreissena polymorpha TaxID=45954 RepID=A0A9D4IE52_DREPO|nr:hypothetical protein DPMN_169955 [Dreissena polymorpha]